jgi:hypothetical protein
MAEAWRTAQQHMDYSHNYEAQHLSLGELVSISMKISSWWRTVPGQSCGNAEKFGLDNDTIVRIESSILSNRLKTSRFLPCKFS